MAALTPVATEEAQEKLPLDEADWTPRPYVAISRGCRLTLAAAMDVCQAAYWSDDKINDAVPDGWKVWCINTGRAKAVVFADGTSVIVAICGSRVNLRDWHRNVSFLFVYRSSISQYGSVHSGFALGLRELIEYGDLVRILIAAGVQSKHVLFVGHSQGGAIAQLALLYVAQRFHKPPHELFAITAGSPRVYSSDVAYECMHPHWRHVAPDDPVPTLPIPIPFVLSYRHYGDMLLRLEHGITQLDASINVIAHLFYFVKGLLHSLLVWDKQSNLVGWIKGAGGEHLMKNYAGHARRQVFEEGVDY